jgi:ferredoxin-NADP reductase
LRDTAFKRVLRAAEPGTQVKVEGPYGDLTLSATSRRPAVFLAGGIGITPFRSIVLDAARNKVQRPQFLFYSNRRPEDAAFLGELRQLQKENPNFTLVATMTQPQKSQQAWQGLTGHIDKRMLQDSIGNLATPIYYIAGPPGMVAALHATLNDAGVSDDDIRAEEFAGY